ncbi:MAG: SDR family oxidoreductase [Myxococcales bacterium]|nr:SDR family oxidoreductase [Myxococcales bacterium]MDH3483378.1 SDR family oxidoreductase [Myxococcales bacterium]
MGSSAKRCIVTGGAGFIGSHLVDRLLSDSHRVSVIDNFSSGHQGNLQHHDSHPNLEIIEADIASAPLTRAFEGVDWVFHLAALADIVPSVENPTAYHHANVTGTFRVLEAARHAGVRRFVYAASSSCYGIPDRYPTPEESPPRPQYPYALTKWVGEQYVLHWAQLYGLPAVSLRFFNVYGPRSRTSGTYGAVFGVFLAQKLAGEPFTVVGDGTQTRDFTYVTDVTNACVSVAASEVQGESLNVGSGDPQSINRLVELIGGDVVHIPKRPGEPDCTQADTRKIEALLGWKACVPFDEGVRIMLENIDYWREAPVWTPRTIEKATEAWFRSLG